MKSAIKEKNRVYKKFLRSGQRVEGWESVKEVRKLTSKFLMPRKTTIRKLLDPNTGIKAFWSSLNRLIGNKNTLRFP